MARWRARAHVCLRIPQCTFQMQTSCSQHYPFNAVSCILSMGNPYGTTPVVGPPSPMCKFPLHLYRPLLPVPMSTMLPCGLDVRTQLLRLIRRKAQEWLIHVPLLCFVVYVCLDLHTGMMYVGQPTRCPYSASDSTVQGVHRALCPRCAKQSAVFHHRYPRVPGS